MGRKLRVFCVGLLWMASLQSQDWQGIPVPANAGEGYTWVLQDQSDQFNYEAPAFDKGSFFFEKWTDFYHNPWTGPGLTVWDREHVFVSEGLLQIPASRLVQNGVDKISTGCITSKSRVIYPVYIEARVKISNSVLASDVWLLSPDDTQEIDICEAYGGDRVTNLWYAERIHLSHHVFIRQPFQDYQPTDPGTWYYSGAIWRDAYHRIGVYWKDPWNLEYYIDGQKVRTVSGEEIIDPRGYTNGTGLSKAMDIIINVEDQTWRSDQGLTPTDAELENADNNTFKVDWIRVYKPEVISVSGVELSKHSISMGIGQERKLLANITPETALNKEIYWSSTDTMVAAVSKSGYITGIGEGTTSIVVSTSDGGFTDTCQVSVEPEWVEVEVDSIRITNNALELSLNLTAQLIEVIYPEDASDQSVSWISRDPSIASVNTDGLITAIDTGQVYVLVNGNNNSADSVLVRVFRIIPGSISVDDPEKYLSTDYMSGNYIDVVIQYEAGTGNTVTRRFGGVQCLLREMQPKWWGIEKEYIFSDTSAIGTRNGTTTIRIDLNDIPASSDLAEGHFYFLYPRFNASDGLDHKLQGLAPITILPAIANLVPDQVSSTGPSVYPNPAVDHIRFNVSREGPFQIHVADIHGRILLDGKGQSGKANLLNIRSLPLGSYYLIIDYGNDLEVSSFSKVDR